MRLRFARDRQSSQGERGGDVLSYIIITLSRYPDIFRQFRESVDRWEPEATKILVQDGDAEFPDLAPPWIIIQGLQPFSFARNANLGIRRAQKEACRGFLLVNDDVRFTGPVLDSLEETLGADPKIGILSPQIQGAAKNPLQGWETGLLKDPTPTEQMVAFVCVALRREMVEEIGLLDEQFVCSFEDDDYCLRAQLAGWKVAVTGRAVVKHGAGWRGGSESVQRRFGGYQKILQENGARFREKWEFKT